MMIRIRSRDGLERVTIDNPNITISQLKTLIQAQLRVPINNQTLSTNQNLLLSKTPQEFTQFSDMANPHLPISSLGLSHGSILYLAYEGERTVIGPSVKAAPAGSFGKKMTMDDLIAKQMRVSRQENPHCEMVSFDRDTANVFQSYVNETMAFGVEGAVSRMKSTVLSILFYLCEVNSISYLDEIAKSPKSLRIARAVAIEVLELLKALFSGRLRKQVFAWTRICQKVFCNLMQCVS